MQAAKSRPAEPSAAFSGAQSGLSSPRRVRGRCAGAREERPREGYREEQTWTMRGLDRAGDQRRNERLKLQMSSARGTRQRECNRDRAIYTGVSSGHGNREADALKGAARSRPCTRPPRRRSGPGKRVQQITDARDIRTRCEGVRGRCVSADARARPRLMEDRRDGLLRLPLGRRLLGLGLGGLARWPAASESARDGQRTRTAW